MDHNYGLQEERARVVEHHADKRENKVDPTDAQSIEWASHNSRIIHVMSIEFAAHSCRNKLLRLQ